MRTLEVMLALTLVGVVAGCHRAPRADRQIVQTFDSAAALLDREAAAPAGVLPDAVLNRSRCVVVVPAATNVGQAAAGVVSCRDQEEHWKLPSPVRFTSSSQQRGAVLLFVLTNPAAARLVRGELDLTGKRAAPAGPIVQKMVTVTDADLNSDAVAYVQKDSALIANPVAGQVFTRPYTPAGKEKASSERLEAAVTSFFNTITPIGIILHHSAVLPGEQTVTTNVRDVESFHRQRGFDIRCQGHQYNVAYHYLVLPNGSVKAGRPERCQGAHARGYNAYIGIAVVGDFSSVDNPRGEKGQTVPTPQQMRSVAQLCRKLMNKYDIPLQRVLRHSDVGTTRCPGDRFPFAALLRTLQGLG